METERRQHERQKLYSPEYFDMGAENGGMIVDISEDGLGFQAVGRVEKGAEIAVSFSLGTGYRISAHARIAWVGANGNSGGTTFTRLPADSRSIIREWVTKTAEAEAARETAAAIQAEITAPETEAEEPPLIIERLENPRAPLSVPTLPKQLAPGEAMAEAPPPELIAPPITGRDVARAAEPPAQSAFPPASQSDVQAEPGPPRQASAPDPTSKTSVTFPVSATPKIPGRYSERMRATAPAATAPAAPPRTEALPTFPPRNTGELFSRSPWVSGQSFPEEKRSHKGLIALIFICLLVVAAIVSMPYIRSYRLQIGGDIEGVGRSLAGQPTQNPPQPRQQPAQHVPQQTVAPHSGAPSSSGGAISANPSLPVTKSLQASAPSASTAAPAPQIRPNAPPANAVSGTPTQNPPVASPLSTIPPAAGSTELLAAAGQTEFQQAQKYLKGTGSVAADPAEAAELFWRSLEKGNIAATIPLADLYLQGKGVSRSCLQARILLTAASNKGNAEATQKLSQLPENCE